MLNNNSYTMRSQRANRAFYFNPEGNIGDGTLPNESEQEIRRAPAPEEQPATETEPQTETTPTSTTH